MAIGPAVPENAMRRSRSILAAMMGAGFGVAVLLHRQMAGASGRMVETRRRSRTEERAKRIKRDRNYCDHEARLLGDPIGHSYPAFQSARKSKALEPV